jgi:hypothetical protein
MKLRPLDFKQPSTWRGLLGFAGLIGWTLSPELRDQIALALAAALSAIELFRDEYREAKTRSGAPAPAAGGQLQRPARVPAVAETADLDPTDTSGGFNDR